MKMVKERIYKHKIEIFIFLIFTVIFICLSGWFIFLDNRYITYQHKNYKKINATVEGWSASNYASDCIYFHRYGSDCYPYTSYVILRYTVNNITYTSKNNINCGNSYNGAINSAKKDYSKNNTVSAYYNKLDPGSGVLLYIIYGGYYWIGIGTCLLMSILLFIITMVYIFVPLK